VWSEDIERCRVCSQEAREREEAEALAATVADMLDVSDLELKVEEGVGIYVLMMGEFEPAGDLHPLMIRKGVKGEGKIIKKQQWSELFTCFSMHVMFWVNNK
jgi:recombinational DNA repair protein RecR